MTMPTAPQAAPTRGAITSMRAKEFVTMRAMTAGVTSSALMSRTPTIFIVKRMVTASMSMSSASMRPTFTPVTSATSGSKVAKRSFR
ncbi:unannotated protein [freshwater metagenome]|uniref:Unannotated protein n=1 Tax=freshwater metagenome TaxID=449393 RepID=A0A6J5YJ54_9ZZZZ